MSERITQVPVETSIQPTDGNIRVTQVPVETSIHPTDGNIRVTQVTAETSISTQGGNLLVTQVAVETSILWTAATLLLVFDEVDQFPRSDYYNLRDAFENDNPGVVKKKNTFPIIFVVT